MEADIVTAAVTCESPAAGMRDFGDQTVSQRLNASDPGALTARIAMFFKWTVSASLSRVSDPPTKRPSSVEEGRERNSQSVTIRSSGARTLEWCARCSLCPDGAEGCA
jgi:hypothetical protein